MFPPPPDERVSQGPPPDDDERFDEAGRKWGERGEARDERADRDDYGRRFVRKELSWADNQFNSTNMVVLVLLAFCCSLFALIFGIVGLATCTDPNAKQRAGVVTIIAGIVLALGVISRLASMGEMAR